MKFVYHYNMDAVSQRIVNNLQLTFKPVPDEDAPVHYHLSETMGGIVAIAPRAKLEYPWKPIQVANIFFSVVDGVRYYCVFQAIGEGLSIAPHADIDLADTQFNDSTQDVCMARTILGATMDMILGEARPEVDFNNAFHFNRHAFYFLHELREEERDEAKAQPLPQIGCEHWGITIGRVKLEEVMDSSDEYDEETRQIIEWLNKQEKKG